MRFSSIGGRLLRPSPILFALFLVALAVPASAQQVVLQNDSLTAVGNAALQAGFAADELGAAWLTSTCDGTLSSVQVAWLSFQGGQPPVLGQAVAVWQVGAFPLPGIQMLELVGPLMNDGFFNDFPVLPGTQVTEGQILVVTFQFLEAPPALGPSLVTDIDGCQAGRNGIFAIPPGSWFDACLLGVSGDLALRAVVNCANGSIFTDGFESGDTMAWSSSVGRSVPPARSPRLDLPVIRSELIG